MTRVSQLIARYVAMALIALATKLGCETSEAQTGPVAEAVASACIAVLLLTYDLIAHKWQAKQAAQEPSK